MTTRGLRCECFNGVAECGAATDLGIHLTAMHAGIVAAGGSVIVLLTLLFCCYLRQRHRRAMETPIEGAVRRSIVMPGRKDYVKSRKGNIGEEVELPAPPQAGGHDSSGVVITRESRHPGTAAGAEAAALAAQASEESL